MYLIVGLGNPDLKYLTTYHNMGFMALDRFALDNNLLFTKKEHKAITCVTKINGEKVILAKPQTYMNLSGQSVMELVNFYKIPLQNLLVIYDDLDIPSGAIRIRKSGSSGTHNGMRNIVQILGDSNFPRVRIGIGQEENSKIPLIDYVLMNVHKEKENIYKEAFGKVSNIITDFCSGLSFDKIMSKYNTGRG